MLESLRHPYGQQSKAYTDKLKQYQRLFDKFSGIIIILGGGIECEWETFNGSFNLSINIMQNYLNVLSWIQIHCHFSSISSDMHCVRKLVICMELGCDIPHLNTCKLLTESNIIQIIEEPIGKSGWQVMAGQKSWFH